MICILYLLSINYLALIEFWYRRQRRIQLPGDSSSRISDRYVRSQSYLQAALHFEPLVEESVAVPVVDTSDAASVDLAADISSVDTSVEELAAPAAGTYAAG